MKCNRFVFNGSDNKKLSAIRWENEDDYKIKGIVQISHGMAENAKRYEGFAKKLTDSGYIVYIHDHRGHGESEDSLENLGYLARENGFDFLVEDMKLLTNIIRKENQGVPVYLFGHSMGSFAAQKYLIDYSDSINAIILSGSCGDFGTELKMITPIISCIEKVHGERHRSKILDNLIFGGNNKQFKNPRTKFDWLSRDEKEVDKYIADNKCGFLCTTAFYRDFINGLKYIENKKNLSKLTKCVPILILSGDKDPIGKNGKGVQNLYERYKAFGVKDVSMKLYKDARHEILNETNKDEVMQDIVEWLGTK
ncbi:alpha/beta hydrolase [Peptacetobacter sp.]|uniref:alpha/beta hydrolase n=1 Tax=Peptacetobacter sp. TaxID=2991975 RepID=UPI002634B20C|nr:alpha/beta hydrolase [Peptacetobacter sp.]